MMDYFSEALKILAPGKTWVNRVDYIEWDESQWAPTDIKPTYLQINAIIDQLRAAEPMRLLREERDRLLKESDWVVVYALEHGTDIPQEWRAYRQTLRDLPSTSSPQCWPTDILIMESVNWPTPPNA